ncbi:MAG: hypothetical protein KGS45_07490 [Planctomycetes bacterium]|nr:hypothetical protein [Planctomycetota bacterium]
MQLRSLPALTRLGLTCLVLVLCGGLIASAAHMFWHHGNRDERPEFTMDDVKAQYQGLESRAPLLLALDRNHPENLDPKAKEALLKWLTGTRIAEDYDNLDAGDYAPAEIIAKNCTSCHSRKAPEAQAVAKKLPLDFFDDVKKVAFSRKIDRTPKKIVAASLHTHSLALGTMSIAIAGLAVCTAWSRKGVGALVFLSGFGLLMDLACQWFAGDIKPMIYGVVAGGAMYALSSGLLLVMVLIDLWRPVKIES